MRRLRLVALAAVLAVLPGCALLPDAGPAGPGRRVEDVPVEPLRVAAAGPRPGAGPEEVVGGFLRAGADSDEDHAVARGFLTPSAADSWQPADGTVVYPDDTSLRVQVHGAGDRRTVELSAPVWARIDPSGHLELAPPGTRVSAQVDVRSTGATWRIDRLPATLGLWMPRYEFERSSVPVRLAFVAAGGRALVPDVRWFAGPRAGLATAVTRALLAGPSPWLGAAVTTGAAPGTQLAVDAVPTTDGVAQVDLTSAALESPPEARRALFAQLAATLSQLPTVSGLQLSVEGAAFQVPGVSTTSSAADLGYFDDVRVGGPPLVLSGAALVRVDPGTGDAVPAALPRASPLPGGAALRTIGAGPGAQVLVGVTADGRRLVDLAGGRRVLATAPALTVPSVDPKGWVWLGDGVPGRVLVVAGSALVSEGGTAAPGVLTPDWLRGRRVTSVAASREGARVAVVSVGSDGRSRLDVAGVLRDAAGRPARLTASELVGSSLVGVRRVTWVSRTELVVLASTSSSGPASVWVVEVGGVVSALPNADRPVDVQAGDGDREIYLVTAAGAVLERSGSGWRSLVPGTALTVPQ